KTKAVYQRLEIQHFRPNVQFENNTRRSTSVGRLEFVGKFQGGDKARFLLLYPSNKGTPAAGKAEEKDGLTAILTNWLHATWAKPPVELDFSTASKVVPPTQADKREPHQAPSDDDLQGLWAEGQAAQFAVLEALTPGFSFYSFACGATGRKYGVAAPALTGG